jgi:hypothetical protein
VALAKPTARYGSEDSYLALGEPRVLGQNTQGRIRLVLMNLG